MDVRGGRRAARPDGASRRQGLVRDSKRLEDTHSATMPRAIQESRQALSVVKCVPLLASAADAGPSGARI